MIMRMVLPRLLPWIIGGLSITAVVSYWSVTMYNKGVGVGGRVIERFDKDTQTGIRTFNADTARENTEYRAAQERGQALYPDPVGDQ